MKSNIMALSRLKRSADDESIKKKKRVMSFASKFSFLPEEMNLNMMGGSRLSRRLMGGGGGGSLATHLMMADPHMDPPLAKRVMSQSSRYDDLLFELIESFNFYPFLTGSQCYLIT